MAELTFSASAIINVQCKCHVMAELTFSASAIIHSIFISIVLTIERNEIVFTTEGNGG
jgi:hypothetical protein